MLKKIKELPEQFERKALEESLTPKAYQDSHDQADPFFTRFHARTTMASVVLVEQGVIQDVFPFLRLYKVALNAGTIIVCTYAGDSTGGLFGVQDQTTLVIGTTVWVVRYPGTGYGTIIATQPEFITVLGSRKIDEIVDGSNVGYISDPIYRLLLAYKPPRGGMPMWDGAHMDSIPGEWVKMAHTGLSIFVDPFLAGIKANDYCGVWVNYLDSLLRIAGLNYQKWTAGTEEYDYLDFSGVITYKGYAYIMPQQFGNYHSDVGVSTNMRGDLNWLRPEFHHHPNVRAFALEPKTAFYGPTPRTNRFPFHHKQSWGGIIGQGGLEYVVTIKFPKDPNKNTPTVCGKIQIANTASGYHIVQAARGILLAKYPLIPVPIKIIDFDEDIKTQTPERRKRILNRIANVAYDLIDVEDWKYYRPYSLRISSSSIRDIRNFLCNWEALLGVYAYMDNFVLATEEELAANLGINTNSEYGRPAFIFIDEEGNILLENGYGTRVELVKTSIRLTAARDITIDCGDELTLFGKKIVIYGAQEFSAGTDKFGINTNMNGEEAFLTVTKAKIKEAEIKRCTLTGGYYPPNVINVPSQPWRLYVGELDSGNERKLKPIKLDKSGFPLYGNFAYAGVPLFSNKSGGFAYGPAEIIPDFKEREWLFPYKINPPKKYVLYYDQKGNIQYDESEYKYIDPGPRYLSYYDPPLL